jgi:fused signal recognition particle receptor
MGFFDKLKQGLQKTHNNIFDKVNKLVYAKKKIDDEFLDELEEILLSADVGVQTTEAVIENLKTRVKEEKYEYQDELNNLLREELNKK